MSEARNRRNRQNVLTLIGALGASLGIVLLVVLVTIRPTNLDRNDVDWGAVWSTTADSAELANPSFSAADGDWWANRAELLGGQYPVWYVGFISPSNGFVALEQFDGQPSPEIAGQLDDVTPTSVALGGETWAVFDRSTIDKPGNRETIYLLNLADSGNLLMVSGTAPINEIELVAVRALESLGEMR